MLKTFAKTALIGGVSGALITLILFIGQDVVFLLVLMGPPYYLDAITIDSRKWVGPVAFIYYAAISSLIACLIILKFSKGAVIATVSILVVIHATLLYLALDLLGERFDKAIDFWLTN